MQITAYKVTKSTSAKGYVAVAPNTAGQAVTGGVRVYSDSLFINYAESSNGTSWTYDADSASWTQPTMSYNQRTLGGSSWGLAASTSSSEYLLSDYVYSTSGAYWTSDHAVRPYNIDFYNPDALLITSFTVWNYKEDFIRTWKFYVSSNGSTWTQVASGSTSTGSNASWSANVSTGGTFKYHRFQIVTGTDSDWNNLREIHIYGTKVSMSSPIITNIYGELEPSKEYVAICKRDGQMRCYIPTLKKKELSYYFYEGQFYDENSAPPGAFPLSAEQYTILTTLIVQGKTLGWHSDQRPYIYEPWTRPNYTSNSANEDGTVFSASSEYSASYAAYKAMDGVKSGTYTGCWVVASGATAAWLRISFPYKLLLTKLTHYNGYSFGSSSESVAVTATYYSGVDTNGQVLINTFTTSTTNWAQYSYGINSGIAVSSIYLNIPSFPSSTTLHIAVGEIEIEASKIIYEVGE